MKKFKYDYEDLSYSIKQYDYEGEFEDIETIDVDWSIEDNLRYLIPTERYEEKLSHICIHALKHFESLTKHSRIKIQLRKNYEEI